MKLIKKDKKKGIVLQIEDNDDLWDLSNFIQPDDIVIGKTTRKIKINEKVVKKTYTVTIQVEKIKFETETLRINGIIESEHDDIPKGSHQSIGVTLNDTITIIKKNILKYHDEKLNEMVKKVKTKVLIVAFDKDNAMFIDYKLKKFNLLFDIKAEGNKKHYLSAKETKTKKSEFFEDIAKEILTLDQKSKYDIIILASPQFWRSKVIKFLDDITQKKITEAKISSVSMSAVNELTNDENIIKILENNEVLKDLNYVNDLLVEISKDGNYAYGLDDVKNNIDQGNVKFVLITTKYLRENKDNDDVFEMLKLAESINAKVHIVNSKNEAGIKLKALGKIAAILRYKNQ